MGYRKYERSLWQKFIEGIFGWREYYKMCDILERRNKYIKGLELENDDMTSRFFKAVGERQQLHREVEELQAEVIMLRGGIDYDMAVCYDADIPDTEEYTDGC